MESVKWVWQYAKQYRLLTVIAIFLVIVTSVLSIVYPLLGGKIVDVVIDQGKTNLLVPILGVMMGVAFLRTVLRYCYQIMFEKIKV